MVSSTATTSYDFYTEASSLERFVPFTDNVEVLDANDESGEGDEEEGEQERMGHWA